ncbi:hypothetical protein [Streptomyces sp. NPDC054863]
MTSAAAGPDRRRVPGVPHDLYAARRWLDSGPRVGGAPGREFVRGAQVVGSALARQHRFAAAEEWLAAAARQHDPLAMRELGCVLVDMGQPDEAERWLLRAADGEDLEALVHLGRLLVFRGRKAEAEPWLRRAVEEEPQLAGQLVDEFRLRGADGVADDLARYAADAGDIDSASLLAREASGRGEHAESDRWADWAGQLGDPANAFLRAQLARERSDFATMAEWLGRASADGDLTATAALGAYLLETGLETGGDPEEGEALLRRAAEGGRVEAQLLVAALCSGREEWDSATDWLELAAQGGALDEVYEYGVLHRAEGRASMAEILLRACAEEGHALGMRELARTLVIRAGREEAPGQVGNNDGQMSGPGQKSNSGQEESPRQPAGAAQKARATREEALLWLRRAVRAVPELPEARLMLGEVESLLGRKDAARSEYHEAARQGDGRAAHKLGLLAHESGDTAAARRWFVQGARAGEASSMFNLRLLTDRESPEEEFPGPGYPWMVLAAAHGHARAALRTGEMEYYLGRPAEAVRWFVLAESLGSPEAASALSALRGTGRRPRSDG